MLTPVAYAAAGGFLLLLSLFFLSVFPAACRAQASTRWQVSHGSHD
jgi:hypothetical protein